LIFKILNSGDYLKDWKEKKGTQIGESKEMLPYLSEKALRYDLTVPFARYVVMNRNEITFPFKRYQIQPVWRADRPQKGRYREFYQCDADVVGTDSLICEAEIVLMLKEVFAALKLNQYLIKINNRKILSGITQVCNAIGKEADVCVAIDKLDKIGEVGVVKELSERGLTSDSIEKLLPIINFKGDTSEKLVYLKNQFINSEIGLEGVKEIEQVFTYLHALNGKLDGVELDLSLARGLSYYTGAIFEVKALGVQIGSIAGGGRYDNLTSLFGLDGVSGVGISFGVDRIYDVLEELNLFDAIEENNTKVLVINFDKNLETHALGILAQLRSNDIKSEIYPQPDKLKKQFGYADSKKIPFVIIAGQDEVAKKMFTLKNMSTGEQQSLSMVDIISILKK
jgi:histidyl-tRNA synthetase